MALISKASLLMVPSTYTDGTLYNVLPSGNRAPDSTDQNSGYDQTRADFTFDRGNNLAATRIDENGVLQKGRENVLLQSNQFDTTWVNFNTSDTSGQSGYDGTNNAWKLSNTGASGYIRQTSLTASGVQTFSIYAKAGSLNWLRVTSQSGNVKFNINLSDGTIGTTGNLVIEAKATALSDGWYRCSMTFNASTTGFYIYPATDDDDTTQTSGNIFIQDAQLETGLVATDVMTSGSTTAKAGVLEDMPRISYDANGENGALLLEGLRSNVITQSEYFGAWSKLSGASVEDNFTTSLEGVKNAAKITYDGTTNGRIELSVTASGTSTQSVYLKVPSGTQTAKIGMGSSDLSTITITDEWQRFTHTGTGSYPRILCDDSAIVYAYGAQVESGASYASSYIPTHGAAVSRSADSCDGAGNSDVINSTEGVLYAEISALADDSTNRHITIWDGTDTNRLVLKYDNQSNVVQVFNRVGGVETAFLGHTLADITISHKIAVRYKANDYALVIDGAEVDTDTSSSTWSASVLSNIKLGSGAGSDFYGRVKQLYIFDEALSDAELVTLTS